MPGLHLNLAPHLMVSIAGGALPSLPCCPFSSCGLPAFSQGNHFHCHLPSCFGPSATPLLCPLHGLVCISLPTLSSALPLCLQLKLSRFTCPLQKNGDLSGGSSAGGAFLQSFLGNSSQYLGNCCLNFSPLCGARGGGRGRCCWQADGRSKGRKARWEGGCFYKSIMLP